MKHQYIFPGISAFSMLILSIVSLEGSTSLSDAERFFRTGPGPRCAAVLNNDFAKTRLQGFDFLMDKSQGFFEGEVHSLNVVEVDHDAENMATEIELCVGKQKFKGLLEIGETLTTSFEIDQATRQIAVIRRPLIFAFVKARDVQNRNNEFGLKILLYHLDVPDTVDSIKALFEKALGIGTKAPIILLSHT